VWCIWHGYITALAAVACCTIRDAPSAGAELIVRLGAVFTEQVVNKFSGVLTEFKAMVEMDKHLHWQQHPVLLLLPAAVSSSTVEQLMTTGPHIEDGVLV
jgi:hypothetical protein